MARRGHVEVGLKPSRVSSPKPPSASPRIGRKWSCSKMLQNGRKCSKMLQNDHNGPQGPKCSKIPATTSAQLLCASSSDSLTLHFIKAKTEEVFTTKPSNYHSQKAVVSDGRRWLGGWRHWARHSCYALLLVSYSDMI